MDGMRSGGFLRRRVAAVLLLLASLAPVSAWAQSPPEPQMLEALIKSTLLTFNDANVTGNYTVFNAKLSKPFRDQFSPDRLKATFRSFSDQNIDFYAIAALKPQLTEEPSVDNRGALLVRGFFITPISRVTFSLDYIQSDGEWKLLGLNVNVKPVNQ
ncbi:MAG: hypothetical protein KIT36_24460 [Alphaproteobacteria bacterium]|nr:hypothetical protein [Alphaproteobacteria bacterium]